MRGNALGRDGSGRTQYAVEPFRPIPEVQFVSWRVVCTTADGMLIQMDDCGLGAEASSTPLGASGDKELC
jgi:hypothetical protein